MPIGDQVQMLSTAHSVVVEAGILIISVLAISRVVAHDIRELWKQFPKKKTNKRADD